MLTSTEGVGTAYARASGGDQAWARFGGSMP
jgi:hypothetical protein